MQSLHLKKKKKKLREIYGSTHINWDTYICVDVDINLCQ